MPLSQWLKPTAGSGKRALTGGVGGTGIWSGGDVEDPRPTFHWLAGTPSDRRGRSRLEAKDIPRLRGSVIRFAQTYEINRALELILRDRQYHGVHNEVGTSALRLSTD